ncbi:hypothetical protein MYRNA_235 [Mycobacterium phage Myrna]|uniref:Uncharacterized protein n=1 Tax=Mycobacterium phage Myrna TaxID=546805 RepID=B5LJK5_9CAUD|nr:gp235 [Mycobacterium phage Myrna]ACH62202.1 hypothetical protein MYRNA_235 [Mycobacterium phage Myrna]
MSINPSKARKKPVEIEVMQYRPGQYTKREWLEWIGDKANIGTKGADYEAGLDETEFVWFTVDTLEGHMNVEPMAWVAKGVEGEFYPIKDSIFEKTYILTEVEGVSVISFDPSIVP